MCRKNEINVFVKYYIYKRMYIIFNSYFALQKVPMNLENSIIFDK